MNRSASLALLASLSPVQFAAIQILPLFQAAFAFFVVAQHSGYPIGF